jgi:hypothetical protein
MAVFTAAAGRRVNSTESASTTLKIVRKNTVYGKTASA